MNKKNEKTSRTQPKVSSPENPLTKGSGAALNDISDRAEDFQSGIKNKVETAKVFLREVRAEFDRITWPTRKETLAMAVAVLVLTLFFTVFLGLVDMTLGKLVSLVLS